MADPDIIRVQIDLQEIRRQLDQLESEFDKSLGGVAQKGRKAGGDLGKGMAQARPQIKRTDQEVKKLSTTMQTMTGRVMRFAGAFTAAFSVVNVVRQAAQVVTAYQDANARLNATLQLTREETEKLRKQQLQLGSSTAFTASQVADAQLELGKLGQTLSEITATTPAVLDLAAATGTDLANAAAITAETLNQFSLEANQAGRVTDIMAKAFSSSALDIQKFSVAMGSAGPVAASAGVSIERTTALIGVLADRGLDASTAGTSLRNMFLMLSKEGITFEEAMKRVRTATDQNAAALELFGTRGATTAVILANNADAANDLEHAVSNASGALREMAEAQLDTLTGDLTRLQSAWEGFILSLEDGEGVISRYSRFVLQTFTTQLQVLQDENLNAFESFNLFARGLVNPITGLDKYRDTVAAVNDEMQEFSDNAQNMAAQGNVTGLIEMREEMQSLLETTEEGGRRFKALTEQIMSLDEVINSTLFVGLEPVKNVIDDQEAAQKGLIQLLKERLELIKKEIEGATSQNEINRLLTEREGIEDRINKLLNDRIIIQDEEAVDPALTENFFDKFLEQAAIRDQFEADTSDFIDNLLQEQVDAYETERSAFADLMNFKRQMEFENSQASIQAAANTFGAISDLFAENAEQAKAFASFQAILNAYGAILQVLNSPVPINPIARAALAASIGVQAFAQVARINSQSVPSFYDGTEYLKRGNNPKGRDTIPVMAHEGEAIINSQQNANAPGLAKAWNRGRLEDWITVKHLRPALDAHKKAHEQEKAALIAQAMRGSVDAHLNDSRIVRQLRVGNALSAEQIDLLKKSKRINPFRA